MKYIPIILCLILPCCGFTAWHSYDDTLDDGADPTAHMRAIIIEQLYDDTDTSDNFIDENFMQALLAKCMGYTPSFVAALLERAITVIPYEQEPLNIPLCLQVFDRVALWAQGPGRNTQWHDDNDLLFKAGLYCDDWSDADFMANLEAVLNGTYVPPADEDEGEYEERVLTPCPPPVQGTPSWHNGESQQPVDGLDGLRFQMATLCFPGSNDSMDACGMDTE